MKDNNVGFDVTGFLFNAQNDEDWVSIDKI